MSKWNEVTDADIAYALNNMPTFDATSSDDELNDFILSNYPFDLPEDDDDEGWEQFYAEGSPFNKFENAIYDKAHSWQDAIKVAKDVDGDNTADNVALIDNDGDPEPDVAIVKDDGDDDYGLSDLDSTGTLSESDDDDDSDWNDIVNTLSNLR